MKRLIGSILITAAIIGFALYAYHFTMAVTESVENEVRLVAEYFESEDYEKAMECAKSAKSQWRYLAENTLFMEYPETDIEITQALARIEELVSRRNDDVYAECAGAVSLIECYSACHSPRLSTVL